MCMTILIGKKASASGEVLIAHNEDAPGRYIMQTHLVKAQHRDAGKFLTLEPDLANLELPEDSAGLFWSEAKTFNPERPGPSFCDLYVNSYGVAICTNNCEYSREDKPELKNGGIGYGLRRLVAERAHSAKEALKIACELVNEYGYASSGRSYAFADKDEIFVMQIVHGKHYAIKRVPDDEAAIIPNHYTIHEPENSEALIDYAIKRGWYKLGDGKFDFAKVYQAENSYMIEKNVYRHIRALEILTGEKFTENSSLPFSVKPSRKVDVNILKEILRSHYENVSHFMRPLTICNIDTLESTIIQIKDDPEKIILRRALGRPCCSPYLTWGINYLPEGFEEKDAEKSLAEHFKTKPEDLNWKDNAWFRAMEIQAACDVLQPSFIHERIKNFETKIGDELFDAKEVKNFMLSLKSELGIIDCEAVGEIVKGEKNFRVKLPETFTLEPSECFCGPSYLDVSKWSKCSEINRQELTFESSEWINDAVPCLTDLYLKLGDKVGCVKIYIRR